MKRKTKNAANCLLLPLLCGCLIFELIPFGMVLHSAAEAGWETFWGLLRSPVFRMAFGNTVKFLVLSLPIVLLLGLAIALMLKEQASRHQGLKSVLLLPYIMPVAGAVLLVELLFSKKGFLNEALLALGLPIADWLHTGRAFPVAMLLYVWKSTGYAAILLLSGLLTIPESVYEAADVDGADRWQRLRYITLPQLWYSIFFAMVFSLINAFKCFREILLIGGAHPNSGIYMLQHFINNTLQNMNYSKLSVASMLLLAVVTAGFVLFYRFVMRKEAYKE